MEEQVSPQEDVMRYASGRFILQDGSVDGIMFAPRSSDEGKLSVSRPIVFSDVIDEALIQFRRVSRLELRPSGKIVLTKIESLQEAALIDEFSISAISNPLELEGEYPADPSHALIIGLPNVDEMSDLLADRLAECVLALHPAVDAK